MRAEHVLCVFSSPCLHQRLALEREKQFADHRFILRFHARSLLLALRRSMVIRFAACRFSTHVLVCDTFFNANKCLEFSFYRHLILGS
jgi:hypothetical protein